MRIDCLDRRQTKINHLNETVHMGRKLAGEIFTLNNASSLWWVGCGEKIASVLSDVYSPNVTMPNTITKLHVLKLLNKP